MSKLRDHSFDGIQELDNDLPRWWVALFFITIVFAAGYMAWFHVLPGPTLAEELEQELDARKAAKAAAAAARPAGEAGAFDFAAATRDPAVIASGKETYGTMCAACHGPEGQGLVGPNLTDDFWLHGATYAAVEQTVTVGILEKGMPAWGEILGADKVRAVVTFIGTIQRTSPANPKAPQGEAGALP